MDNDDDTFVMNLYGRQRLMLLRKKQLQPGNATTTISGNQTAAGKYDWLDLGSCPINRKHR
jgi:hypothetical protein